MSGRRAYGVFTALLVLAGVGGGAYGAEEPLAVVMAAGRPLDGLSMEKVRAIFNRNSLVDEQGNRWIPVNLPAEHPLRRSFTLTLFQSLPEDQEDYWNKLYFHGIAPPEVLASEEAVLRFVAATPGAIGYVRASLADPRTKTLLLLPRDLVRPR